MPHLSSFALATLTVGLLNGADWPQFRGANARGVSDATNLPVQFGPSKNVIWKTALPAGHSSPVLSADRIFVTAFDANKLYVISMERAGGKILWRREVPRPRKQELHKSNSPASPSIATDGKNTFAFFTDFGLISHGAGRRGTLAPAPRAVQQPVWYGSVACIGQWQSDPGLRLRNRVISALQWTRRREKWLGVSSGRT